jgi:hypothetical protein
MTFDPLNNELVKIAKALEPRDVKLIIGGGYGLALKTQQIIDSGKMTRLEIPPARSTEDIDLFLQLEIITDAEKMEAIRGVLENLNYKPVANFFQFETDIELPAGQGTIKVDLLAPSPQTEDQRERVKISKPRIRPHNAKNIHAYLTEAAITIEEKLTLLSLSHDQNTAEVFLPHPYTFLVLKLFALRDHLKKEKESSEDQTKEPKAQEHAFDIYRIVSMFTETEWGEAKELANQYRADEIIMEAREITSAIFGSLVAEGSLAVRRHAATVGFEIENSDLQKILDDLHELFVS